MREGKRLTAARSLRGDYLAFTEKSGLSVQDPLPKFTYIYKDVAGGVVGHDTDGDVKVLISLDDLSHIGGWGGIRTHGALAGTPVFKTGALNHSATHPYCDIKYLLVSLPTWERCVATGLPPPSTDLFLFGAGKGERRFHHLRSSVIRIREQVAIDPEGDRRRAMTEPTADGQHVHA
jgi:hypothetical protein